MSQSDIYNLLKKSKAPMSRKEISIATSIREEVVSARLRKMLIYGEVKYIELDRIKVKDYCDKVKIPRVKQRMRLYFIAD